MRHGSQIVVILGFLLATRDLVTQVAEKCPTPRKNQHVTIEFERLDERKGTILLRLHNFTDWDIRIPVEMAFPGEKITGDILRTARNHKDGAEAPVRYCLEEYDPRPTMQITDASGHKSPPDEPEHPPVPKIQRVDFLTEWWIPQNQSVVFEVPKEHLARNVMLSVLLRYEWEDEHTSVETLNGPVHLVYFRGIDLPEDVQAKIK